MINVNQLRIIEEIYKNNLSIKELEQKLNLSYITIIRNLKQLKQLDLITSKNEISGSLLALSLKELV
ncbi:HTH domain-containing protein, partial [bacterium]|nr:HTH domain-containing protein [bacterium]